MLKKTLLFFIFIPTLCLATNALDLDNSVTTAVLRAQSEISRIDDFQKDEGEALSFFAGQNICNVQDNDYAKLYMENRVNIGHLRGLYTCLLDFYSPEKDRFNPPTLDAKFARRNLIFLTAVFSPTSSVISQRGGTTGHHPHLKPWFTCCLL